MKNIIILASMFLFFGNIVSAQAYYKIQDRPGELTKKVNLWGYVNNPGRYEVPASTNLIQLVTYAGGPKEYASMSDIRIFRVTNDITTELDGVDLDDPARTRPEELALYNEDTIVIESTAWLSWKEFFSFISAPLAITSSIAIIIWRLTE